MPPPFGAIWSNLSTLIGVCSLLVALWKMLRTRFRLAEAIHSLPALWRPIVWAGMSIATLIVVGQAALQITMWRSVTKAEQNEEIALKNHGIIIANQQAIQALLAQPKISGSQVLANQTHFQHIYDDMELRLGRIESLLRK